MKIKHIVQFIRSWYIVEKECNRVGKTANRELEVVISRSIFRQHQRYFRVGDEAILVTLWTIGRGQTALHRSELICIFQHWLFRNNGEEGKWLHHHNCFSISDQSQIHPKVSPLINITWWHRFVTFWYSERKQMKDFFLSPIHVTCVLNYYLANVLCIGCPRVHFDVLSWNNLVGLILSCSAQVS